MNLLAALASVRIFPRKVSHQTLTTRWGKALDPQHILEEYPRPQMIRDQYINLNGEWNYTVLSKKNTITKEGTLLVPFSPEAPLSGAGFQLKPHEKMLCERLLSVKCLPSDGSRCILHFGAVDQYAKVLVNGKVVVSHIGGYLPFSADITDALQEGCNTLTVHIEDRSDTSYHSVGKQKLKRGGMFYTAQSGIWQTVWMEWVPAVYVKKLELTPLYEKETVHVSLLLNHPISGCSDAEAVVCHVRDMDGRLISKGICTNQSDSLCCYSCYCDVNNMHPWNPDDPYLYTIEIQAGEDKVTGYFAMRTFTIEPDKKGLPRFCLNHEPLFLNGVLDQGYWPYGLYTAPSDEALIYDIQTMKNLGFNMIRKHVKVETARWYYHCDRLGMIVWQDMVNGGTYNAPFMTWLPALFPKFKLHTSDRIHPLFGRKNVHGREEFIRECKETVTALKAFPCISTWVIFNEGWGQFQTEDMTRLLREMDPDRLIDQASGWFDQGGGDFSSLHNYFFGLFIRPERKRASALSEYGGYSYPVSGHTACEKQYGYGACKTREELNKRCTERADKMRELIPEGLCASVYTQWSDIEEEVNGVYTYDRKIRKIDRV